MAFGFFGIGRPGIGPGFRLRRRGLRRPIAGPGFRRGFFRPY